MKACIILQAPDTICECKSCSHYPDSNDRIALHILQYGDHIYWSSPFKKAVERAEKVTGRRRTIFHTGLKEVMEIRFVAAVKQTGNNPCAVDNGHCSHLCLYQGVNTYVCACPDNPDGRTCFQGILIPKKAYALF